MITIISEIILNIIAISVITINSFLFTIIIFNTATIVTQNTSNYIDSKWVYLPIRIQNMKYIFFLLIKSWSASAINIS